MMDRKLRLLYYGLLLLVAWLVGRGPTGFAEALVAGLVISTLAYYTIWYAYHLGRRLAYEDAARQIAGLRDDLNEGRVELDNALRRLGNLIGVPFDPESPE